MATPNLPFALGTELEVAWIFAICDFGISPQYTCFFRTEYTAELELAVVYKKDKKMQKLDGTNRNFSARSGVLAVKLVNLAAGGVGL